MNLTMKIKKWNKMRVLERELKNMDEAEIFSLIETKYGEPVLIGVVENDESVLTIQLLYTELNKIYRATFLGNYDGTKMIISDIKVLKEPSYAAKNSEPFGRGYGTLLMTEAIKAAKSRGINEFAGDRVSTNPEQLERQLNYYSKFGFSINNENKLHKTL